MRHLRWWGYIPPRRPGTVCAWCKAIMQRGQRPVSHGICTTCAEEWTNADR